MKVFENEVATEYTRRDNYNVVITELSQEAITRKYS